MQTPAKKRFSRAVLLEELDTAAQALQAAWNFSTKQGTAQLGNQYERWQVSSLADHSFSRSHQEYLQQEAIAYGRWRMLKDLLYEYQDT